MGFNDLGLRGSDSFCSDSLEPVAPSDTLLDEKCIPACVGLSHPQWNQPHGGDLMGWLQG